MAKKKATKKATTKTTAPVVAAPADPLADLGWSTATKAAEQPASEGAVKNRYFQRPTGEINLFKNCLIVDLSFSKPGNSRQVKPDELETSVKEGDGTKVLSADAKKRLKTQKELLDSPEFEDIKLFDSRLTRYLAVMSLPNDQLKKGMYLIPAHAVKLIDDELNAKAAERKELIEKFLAKYPEHIEKAKADLGPLFDAAEYPSVERMRRKFSMRFKYLEFGVSKTIQTIDAALFAKETAKQAETMKDMVVDIANGLRAGFKESLENLINQLKPTDPTKRKRLTTSSIEKVMDFINSFDIKNLGDDKDMKALIDKAKNLVGGNGKVDAFDFKLRNDDDYRDKIADGFRQITEEMKGMVYEDESRDVIFE